MIDQKQFLKQLQDAGVDFITGVPDTLLNDFCLHAASTWPDDSHVIAANEGNAVALAAGHHLGTGGIPLVYMQNSGLGNATNPLLSLTNREVYSIPMVLLIGWRGDPEVADHPQHQKQGRLTIPLLEAMEIPFKILRDDEAEAFQAAQWAVDTAREQSVPTALVVKKGVLAKLKKDEKLEDSPYPMTREQAIECVLDCIPQDAICVATTGRATRELHALRGLKGMGHENDFLNVGAMGHASSIALGIALAKPNRLVVCLDGDAAAIMHLGALTTTGKLNPSNLLHVVLNNGAHESVGGQLSAGFNANLTAIAENTDFNTPGRAIETKQELAKAVNALVALERPAFVEVRIRKGIRPDLPPLKIIPKGLKGPLMKDICAR